MINVLALALLVSSLAAAGVWSPSPSPGDRTVVREGHRVIVVEYESRRAPSETPPPPTTTTHELLDEARDKFHEATSHLPNLGQGISTPEAADNDDVDAPTHSAKEVICDAYGSCKEKLSHIFSKSKEQVSDKASHLKQEAQHLLEEGKEQTTHMKQEAQAEISQKASHAKEKTENAVKEAIQGGKDVVGNLSSAAEEAAGRAEEMAGAMHRNLSDILRRARDVAGDAAGFVHAGEAARAAGSVAHLLGFAVAYGTGFWVTFVSSYVLATALPRQQFGVVQSKMYPVYFRAMAYGVGLAAAAQWLGKGMEERAQGYNLVAVLGLVLVNLLYLEPKATKVMFERMKMEKEEGRGRDMADVIVEPVMTASTATAATTKTHETTTTYGVRTARSAAEQEAIKGRAVKLSKRLKNLNNCSSVLNILSLMGLTWHLVHLAGRMQVTC